MRSLANFGALILLSALLVACGSDKKTNPAPKPATIPANDTPRNLMLRFREVYQQKREPDYAGLFTTDFRFLFSPATDPTLAAQYGDNWGLSNEKTYGTHLLLGGGMDESGNAIPPARRIVMSLDPYPMDDTTHVDSLAFYKTLVVPLLHLEIEIPTVPDPTTFVLEGRYQFWMVRGDAAALSADQTPDSLHWYIRRWEDQSAPSFGILEPPTHRNSREGAPLPSDASTWGTLKGIYR